jgi:hypothetical protein
MVNNRLVRESWIQDPPHAFEGAAFDSNGPSGAPCFEFDNNRWMEGAPTAGPTTPLTDFTEGAIIASPWSGTDPDGTCAVTAAPTMTITTHTLPESSSCTEGNAACNDINVYAESSYVLPDGAPDERWRYNCGGSSSNIMDDGTESDTPCTRGHCSEGTSGYQDNAADLWYDYPSCDDASTCTFTDVCDFQAESAGDKVVKVYVEAGPSKMVRPSTHSEITFTVSE